MMKLLASFLVAILACTPASAQLSMTHAGPSAPSGSLPAPVWVQGGGSAQNAGSSVQCEYGTGITVTANDTVIYTVEWPAASSTPTFGTGGTMTGTYSVVAGPFTDVTSGTITESWAASGVGAGSTFPEVTWAVLTAQAVCSVDDISGAASTSAIDGTPQFVGSSSSGTVTTPSFTTTVNNDLLFGWGVTPLNFNGIAAGTGFTAGTSFANTLLSESKTQATAGSVTVNISNSSAVRIILMGLAIKP